MDGRQIKKNRFKDRPIFAKTRQSLKTLKLTTGKFNEGGARVWIRFQMALRAGYWASGILKTMQVITKMLQYRIRFPSFIGFSFTLKNDWIAINESKWISMKINKTISLLNERIKLNQLSLSVIEKWFVSEHGSSQIQDCAWNNCTQNH